MTQRNRKGDLVGSIEGSKIIWNEGEIFAEDYVIRFSEDGPLRAVPVLDVRTGKTSMGVLSDFARNGFEIVKSDTYSLVRPSTGAVYNAIEPHDVAFALSPFKFNITAKFSGQVERERLRSRLRNSHGIGWPVQRPNRRLEYPDPKKQSHR